MGMSTGGGSGRSRAPMSEINVTPFVDVMLVLLIIFMVSAPLMTKGVTIDLPNAQAPQMEIQEQKLLLSITADKKVYLGEAEIPYDKLEDALTTNERLKTEKELYVRADTEVPYGFVVRILALIREAGIEKLGIVTDPLASDEE